MPSVGLDVSRENLAVSIVFQDPEIRIAASSLCVFNWRTGEAKTVSAGDFLNRSYQHFM